MIKAASSLFDVVQSLYAGFARPPLVRARHRPGVVLCPLCAPEGLGIWQAPAGTDVQRYWDLVALGGALIARPASGGRLICAQCGKGIPDLVEDTARVAHKPRQTA